MGDRPAGEEVKPEAKSRFKNIKFKSEHVRRPMRRISMRSWEPNIDDVLARLSSPDTAPAHRTGTDDDRAGPNK